MSFVTFAWTSAPLMCDAKGVTRRNWTAKYARQFRGGQVVDAWNCSPRNSGKKIARLRLLQTPYIENTLLMPDADYELEGYAWLDQHKECWPRQIHGHPTAPDEFAFTGGWARWKAAAQQLYVVRFTLIEKLVPFDCVKVQRGAI